MNLNKNFYVWFFIFFIFSLLIEACERKKNFELVKDEEFSLKEPFRARGKSSGKFRDDDRNECIPNPEKLLQSGCKPGFLCVSSMFDQKKGICLQECGEVIDGKLKKRPNVCPHGTKCMLQKSEDLSSLGMFCLRSQSRKDLPCEAAFDEDACAQGLSCLPTIKYEDESGKTHSVRNQCKKECNNPSDCQEPDTCLYPSYARVEPQTNSEKQFVACDVSKCEKNDIACSCDRSSHFYCKAIITGVDRGFCVRSLGICGKHVKPAKQDDFHGRAYIGEMCNELSDNRICAHDPQNDSEAHFACHNLRGTHEGYCAAYCSLPALDQDGDGIIGTKESGLSLNCPTGYSCKTGLSRKIAAYVYLVRGGNEQPCDRNKCPEHEPCDDCGPGDAECVRTTRQGEEKYLCGAPIGICEAD